MRKRGILIVNHSLKGTKYSELEHFLHAAAEKRGISLSTADNAALLFDCVNGAPLSPLPEADFGIFWDKDVRLAHMLEGRGLRLFNSAKAVALCDDKSYTHMALSGHGIPMPKTVCAPMRFKGVACSDNAFLDDMAAYLRYPYIIKECCGSFGQQVYCIHGRAEAEALLARMDGTPLIFQEFIQTSLGRDLRINVVGGEVKAAMLRINANDFRANITNGGRAEAYTPNEAQSRMALDACRLLNLDFAGVDLLFGENGAPILCEVNSNAHFKSIFDCMGVNLADALLAHIEREVYGA